MEESTENAPSATPEVTCTSTEDPEREHDTPPADCPRNPASVNPCRFSPAATASSIHPIARYHACSPARVSSYTWVIQSTPALQHSTGYCADPSGSVILASQALGCPRNARCAYELTPML